MHIGWQALNPGVSQPLGVGGYPRVTSLSVFIDDDR
jgi:hypothetical protein